MRKHAIALLAIVLTAAFLTSVQAQAGGPMFGGGPGAGIGGGFGNPELMLEHMADHLDLDDVQRESVRNTFEAARPEIQALREQARANREALQALDTSNPNYEIELNAIAQSNGQLATEGTLLFTRIRTEIQAVLTDEQREKLARSKARMKQAFQRRLQRQ